MFHRRKRIRRQTLVVVMFSREATVSMFCYFYFFYSSPVTVASSVLLFLNDRPLLSTVPMLDLCHHLAILMVYFLFFLKLRVPFYQFQILDRIFFHDFLV